MEMTLGPGSLLFDPAVSLRGDYVMGQNLTPSFVQWKLPPTQCCLEGQRGGSYNTKPH